MNKESQSGSDPYLASRAQFAETVGLPSLFDFIDAWPLYVGKLNLARFLVVQELVRAAIEVEGDIAECGSWRGANLVFMAKCLEIFDPGSPKRIHCFESFRGLSGFTEQDGPMDGQRGRYAGDRGTLEAVIELYELDRIVIHEGLIESTVPDFLRSEPDQKFSLVYYDADLYSPCVTVLKEFHPRLPVGGIFALDEYGFEDWPGETQAVDEFLAAHGRQYCRRDLSNGQQPSLVLTRTSA